jgi:hypothetical protein
LGRIEKRLFIGDLLGKAMLPACAKRLFFPCKVAACVTKAKFIFEISSCYVAAHNGWALNGI